jgi:hypothetical protein
MLLILVVCIYSVVAAVNISQYSGYKTSTDIYRAYEDCAISAVLCLGSLGIIAGVLIYYHYSSYEEQDINKNIKNDKDVKNIIKDKIKDQELIELVK